MNKRELSQLYFLNRDIEWRRQKVEQLENEAQRVTTQLSDMPKGGGFQDRLSKLVAQIVDEKKMILFKLEEVQIERRKLEYYISSIPDAKIRVYMQFRYMDGLSWVQVAHHAGNEVSDEGARIAVERFLKREKSNEKNRGKMAEIR